MSRRGGFVPPEASAVPVESREQVLVESRVHRPARRYQVHLSAPERRATPPLIALTDRVDRDGIVLLVLEGTVRGVVGEAADSHQITIAFCEAYGHRVELRIQDGARHLWTGAAQLRAVETVPSSNGSLFLAFRYVQPLSPRELRSLGVEV